LSLHSLNQEWRLACTCAVPRMQSMRTQCAHRLCCYKSERTAGATRTSTDMRAPRPSCRKRIQCETDSFFARTPSSERSLRLFYTNLPTTSLAGGAFGSRWVKFRPSLSLQSSAWLSSRPEALGGLNVTVNPSLITLGRYTHCHSQRSSYARNGLIPFYTGAVIPRAQTGRSSR
jgi:hypothetical protein